MDLQAFSFSLPLSHRFPSLAFICLCPCATVTVALSLLLCCVFSYCIDTLSYLLFSSVIEWAPPDSLQFLFAAMPVCLKWPIISSGRSLTQIFSHNFYFLFTQSVPLFFLYSFLSLHFFPLNIKLEHIFAIGIVNIKLQLCSCFVKYKMKRFDNGKGTKLGSDDNSSTAAIIAAQ